MIFSSGCDRDLETGSCNCDYTAECDEHDVWELKNDNSSGTSDSVFYEESHFCSKIDDSPFKPCRSVHTVSENLAIEIRDENTISVDLPPISWHGYNCLPQLLNVCKAGRNVLINGQWANGKPFIQGGPLNGSYIFSQIHFHAPSEHEIDGKRYPLEMHVVHYKTNYLTQERAMEEKDGTIVLVYLFEVKDSPDTVLSMFTKQSYQSRLMRKQTEITGVPLNQIVKPFYSHYYIYWGSINTMKKSYLLQWIISCSLLYATEEEVYDIFHLMKGGSSTGRRVPLMKPLNNAVYYAGGNLMIMKQEETATQCSSATKEVSTASQSCQTILSVEPCKKDIQVQVATNESSTTTAGGRRLYKLRLEECSCKTKNCTHRLNPRYVLDETNWKTKEKSRHKTPSSTNVNMPSCSRSCIEMTPHYCYHTPEESLDSVKVCCKICKKIKCRSKSSKCLREDHCKCKKEKKKKEKEKRKLKSKGSKCSRRSSSLELNDCLDCKSQECVIKNDSSKCAKKCDCHCKKKSKKKKKLKSKKSKSSGDTSSLDLKECNACKNLGCTAEDKPSKCIKNCECHCKKKSKKKKKPKSKKSKSSGDTSSLELEECSACKNLGCTAEDKPSKCIKKCDCHSKKKSKKKKKKLKSKKSKSSGDTSSLDLEECYACKNLGCTAEDKPSKCIKNCECHCKKKSKKKKKLKRKKSTCSRDSSLQDLDECQICQNLEDESLECQCEKQKKSKEKRKQKNKKRTRNSSESSSLDFVDCQTFKYLECTTENEPMKNTECDYECDVKEKKKATPVKTQKKKCVGKKVPAEDSTECEEKVKCTEICITKKTRIDDDVNDCESKPPCLKTKSKSKVADSSGGNCTKVKKNSKAECSKQISSVNYVLTPLTIQKASRAPKVLYKSDENERRFYQNSKACNFLISEDSSSAFASTYRLPQLKTKEPLKEFFLQTEHLFHTEKKGGFSMCTSQDYRVTIVYNQNVVQEFKGTFSPNKLQLGDCKRLNLTPVYPEPETVAVYLEDCFVKMETLNKLYIRAKFLLKPSILNLASSAKNEFLTSENAELQKLMLLSEASKINLLSTKETYLVNNGSCGQSRSLEQFITPRSSLNEKELNKVIPQKKECKKQGYEIELLKKPPDEIQTSKSTVFDTDHSYETKRKKEKSQKIVTKKTDKPKHIFCKSKKNLCSTKSSVEKSKGLEKKALTGKFKIKKEKYPLCKKEEQLPLKYDSLTELAKSLVIQNNNLVKYSKSNVKSGILIEEVSDQFLPLTYELSQSDKAENTIVLYYNDCEDIKLNGPQNKIKSIQYQSPLRDAGPSEVSKIKKPKDNSCKSESHKSAVLVHSQTPFSRIRQKINAPKLKKKNVLDSQKTVKKANPSMIPVRTKRRQQK